MWKLVIAAAASLVVRVAAQEPDDIGLHNGITNITLKSFEAKFINDSGSLISLRPTGSDFDFLPYDKTINNNRITNGSYYWGDITIRFREYCGKNKSYQDGNSAALRTPVTPIDDTNNNVILSADLSPTMNHGPLNITREWLDMDGDLALQFTISNAGDKVIELGSLGLPAAVNSIFTSRHISDMYEKCSLMDPYIGLDAGHLRVTPISGNGPALVVTPLEGTPLEAYRYLDEESRGGTRIGSNGWEGFFEWQVHSRAWANNEWAGVEPWNPPSRAILRPGDSRKYGVRFSVATGGIRDIDNVIRERTETPTAIGVPGYILSRDLPGRLWLQSSSEVASTSVYPDGALELVDEGNKTYTVVPSESAWGRVRLTIHWDGGKTQTVSYYITKPASKAVADLSSFLTDKQWFVDESDPFGRSPSVMSYDNEVGAIVDQELRSWIAGLSDEGGAGSYVAAAIKQAFQPNKKEITKLEQFIDKVMFGTIQNSDYSVKRSTFYYEPSLVPGYTYDPSIDWSKSYVDQHFAYEINRAYNYVWPAATYWAFYRVARAYPDLVEVHDWQWYLEQAHKTVLRGMQDDVAYNTAGLMGETVFGEILRDLVNEDWTEAAGNFTAAMKGRVDYWMTEDYPFGSEQSWDCTGQEGVYFWTKYFGDAEMSDKARNSVIGYTPTVPHWAYNGNARRYWDFVVTGKKQAIERQIHHYGSGLNALVLLDAYRADPSDSYYLRVGYGGTAGPLSNIGRDGSSSCAMHAWPEHLFWDAYTGDYGPNFVGLALGSGAYLAEDADVGLVAYGGVLDVEGRVAMVEVRDAVRQRVFVGMLGVEVRVDAGVIERFSYDLETRTLKVTLAQREDGPEANAAIVWVSKTSSSGEARDPSSFEVSAKDTKVTKERGGTRVPLSSGSVEIRIS